MMKASIKIEDIVFSTRAEAETVLFKLQEQAKIYGSARVSDLYELSDLACSYLMDRYIWLPNSLRGINVVSVTDGYMIDLPPASLIGPTNAKVTYRSYNDKKSDSNKTKEPLTITINTDDIKDFDAVLAETFKYVHTITDRPVYISII